MRAPERQQASPTLDGWLLYITNHFTHPVREAQLASPRYHLARKLAEKGQKMIVFCPLGTHTGNPLQDFLSNLRPRRTVAGNTVYLFPPVLVSPASATTVLTLVMGTLFAMAYLSLTRIKVAAQYSTTILVGSVASVLCKTMKIPFVANYGDPDFAREHGLSGRAFKFCENLVLSRRSPRAVVFVDEVIGSHIEESFPGTKTVFLPNGGYESGFEPPRPDSPSVSSLRTRLGLEGRSVVLYAGQITRGYRLDLLVSAAPSIISKVPNAAFLLIGSGSELNTLTAAAREAHLEERFVFTGALPYDSLSPYIVLGDVCLQLLDDMCMGTKVIMYMAHRRATVSTGRWFERYGRFLKNHQNAVLLPPDSEALGLAVAGLLDDPDERARLGAAGWESVRPYSWDEHADVTLALLQDAVSMRRSSGR